MSKENGNEFGYNKSLPESGILACTSWNDGMSYNVKQLFGTPPKNAIWYHDPVMHTQRILPGHFGHDVLNNYFWMFATTWEEGMYHRWKDPAFKLTSFIQDEQDDKGNIANMFIWKVKYNRNEDSWNRLHCFKTAFLSTSHTHDLNLVFKQRTPSAMQKHVWRDYRDTFVKRGCPSCSDIRPRPRSNKHAQCAHYNIVVLQRSTSPKANFKLVAGGDGRRIGNHQGLIRRLSEFGRVTTFDPGNHSMTSQISTMMEADIVISRMSSQVVGAMFMPPGGLCIEVEANDPSHLFYDHPSTFEELADLYNHTFMRSSIRVDDESVPTVGPIGQCRAECERFNIFKLPDDNFRERQCKKRCGSLNKLTNRFLSQEHYRRPEWYQNWWLSDTNVDVDAIADLIRQWCDQSHQRSPVSNISRFANGLTTYKPSWLETVWYKEIATIQTEDSEWDQGCRLLRTQKSDIQDMLTRIRTKKYDHTLFSYWNSSGEFIEPLIGHLRHPFFHCVGNRKDTFELMFDTNYLVLPQISRTMFKQVLLFDVGASSFDDCAMGCQKWFVDEYRKIGLPFDKIVGWEAKPLDHREYWAKIPADLKYRIQLFNTPANADVDSTDNPLNHIRNNADVDDYVVLKLDIDHIDTEIKLVEQILRSPEIISKVDEFFWEHHAWGSPLKQTRVYMFEQFLGWKSHTSRHDHKFGRLEHTYEILTKMRSLGIRAHSWI